MKTFLTLLLLLAASVPALAEESAPKSFVAASDEAIGRIEAMHRQAEGLIIQNDFKGAINVLDEILLLEPDDEVAYAQTGHCYMILGDFTRAEQAFQNALYIDPENETARLGIQKIHDPDGVLTQKEIPLEESNPPISEPLPAEEPENKEDETASPVIAAEPEPFPPAVVAPQPVSAPASTLPAETPPATKAPSFEENIQRALKNAGLYEGAIDGAIGPASRKAIQAFQSSRGLKVDGKVGPETWKVLQAYLEIENLPAQ